MTAAVSTGRADGRAASTGKRLLVWGFILSTLFTTTLTIGGGYFVQTLQSRHIDRKEQIDQFRTLSGQMDGLVTAFQERYLTSKETSGDRLALQKNIQDQYNSLERVEPLLGQTQAAVAKRYRSEIVAVFTQLDSLPPPSDARALMQAIATARDTRIDVDHMLLDETQRWL